jgi:AAA domain
MRIQSDDFEKNRNLNSALKIANPLSEPTKIRAILSTWLDYIRLEDLTNAKVDAVKYEIPYVWDKGVSLLGERLIIEKTLFKTLKQEFETYEKQDKLEDYQIAVAFPTIVQFENNLRKFHPLFTIDISSTLRGNYLAKGWDLTNFEFHPVLPNLIKFYGIEEEEAENLPTREGLRTFLESTFNRPFSTLQDFLQLIDLPPKPWRTQTSPYLLRFGYASYNHHLKKDFQSLLEQLDWSWDVPTHPAYQYLFGLPQPPNRQKVFLGAFPTQAPDDYQASALFHALDCFLTAVIGPPGHGKTYVVLHKIAQQVVKRAVQLARLGVDESNLTVVASTNNRAVSHVEALLAETLSTDFFYLSQVGDDKELAKKKVLPKLQAALNWLSETTFNRSQWEATKEELLEAIREFQSHQEQDEFSRRQRTVDEQQLEQYRVEIENLTAAIEELQQELQQLPLDEEADYSQFPTEAMERIALQLDSAWQKLSQKDSHPRPWYRQFWNWLLTPWRWLTKQTGDAIIDRLNKKIKEDVALTKDTPFALELIVNRPHFEYWRSYVLEQLSAAQEWLERAELRQRTLNRLNTLQQQLAERQQKKQQLQSTLTTYPATDFYSRFYTDYHPLQIRLFELSWQFQQQEALRRKEEVTASIRTYIGVLNGDWETKRQFGRDWLTVYRDISLLFPVFLSTLHSLRRLFPYLHNGCIDQAIIDEAGQIPPHQPFPLLVRSRRAMLLGDPWQLEPVISLSESDKELYRAKAFLARGLTDTDYDRYSPTALSAYHRAAGGSGKEGDLGNGIILRQHYRSVPVIAGVSNLLCNYSMIIKTSPSPSLLGANLIACHVEGKIVERVNQAELDAVEALIEELIKAGYYLNSPDKQNTIGAISPYRRQADALIERLRARWKEFALDSIGTVHTFQGGQKSVIILSTRQCDRLDSLWFIDRRPNLLNVAVSRARELFILVGNLDLLLKGNYTKQLVEYIKQFGEIRGF